MNPARLNTSIISAFNALQGVFNSLVLDREVNSKSVAEIRVSVASIREMLDEIDKQANTLDYNTYRNIEHAEMLSSASDKLADVATLLKNIDWSPTFVKNMLLVVPPAVLAEAINSIKSEDWRDIIALRVVDR